MGTFINGVYFDHDARAYEPNDTYALDTRAVAGKKFPRTERSESDSRQMQVELPLAMKQPRKDIAKLQGLVQENSYLYIQAEAQYIYSQAQNIFFKVEDIQIEKTPGAPTFAEATLQGQLAGVPPSAGGNTLCSMFLGGTLEASGWDNVYFSFDRGNKDGYTPSDGVPKSWDPREENDWDDQRGKFDVHKFGDGLWAVRGDSDSGDNLSFWLGDNFDDGVLQANVRFGKSTTENVGLMFRMQSSADDAQGYIVDLDGDNLRFRRRTGDDSYTNIKTETFSASPNTWYTVAIHADGSTFYVYVDGELKFKAEDSNNSSAGRFGLHYTGASDPVYWRDVLMTQQGSPRETTVFTKEDCKVADSLTDFYVPVGENIVANPGFEQGGNGDDPSGWAASDSLNSASVNDGDSAAGDNSVELDGGGNIKQTVLVDPSEVYVVEAWVKPGDETSTLTLEMEPTDGDGDKVTVQAAQRSGLWKKLRMYLTPEDIKNSTQYRVRLVQDAGVHSWDYVMVRRAEGAVVSPNELVIGSDSIVGGGGAFSAIDPFEDDPLAGVSGPSSTEREQSF